MKGFIHLLEIAIATILIAVVLATIFSVRVKENWERVDIVVIGNNILNYIKQDEGRLLDILDENLNGTRNITPPNVKFGLRVLGSPKSLISVGCVDTPSCTFLNNILTPVYVNGRWINFSLEYFDIDNVEFIPPIYDAVVFVNYTGYSSQKENITNYLERGGAVIGINSTTNFVGDQDFRDIFNLSPAVGAGPNLNFSIYDPYKNKVAKYFLGYGFDAAATWQIWEQARTVSYGSTPFTHVNITGVTQTFLAEDSIFDLVGPDGRFYFFKVRRIDLGQMVDIQPLNTSFVFLDFSENNCEGNNILTDQGVAGMTNNNSAIWMSDFGAESHEYWTLIKAAISASTDEWAVKEIETTKEIVSVSSFFSLCCDMQDVLEIVVDLSYLL